MLGVCTVMLQIVEERRKCSPNQNLGGINDSLKKAERDN